MSAADSASANGRWSDSAVLVSSFWALRRLCQLFPTRPVPGLWQRTVCLSVSFHLLHRLKEKKMLLLKRRHLPILTEPLTSRASCFGDAAWPWVYKQPSGRWAPLAGEACLMRIIPALATTASCPAKPSSQTPAPWPFCLFCFAPT